jgi:hypothetical protein
MWSNPSTQTYTCDGYEKAHLKPSHLKWNWVGRQDYVDVDWQPHTRVKGHVEGGALGNENLESQVRQQRKIMKKMATKIMHPWNLQWKALKLPTISKLQAGPKVCLSHHYEITHMALHNFKK